MKKHECEVGLIEKHLMALATAGEFPCGPAALDSTCICDTQGDPGYVEIHNDPFDGL